MFWLQDVHEHTFSSDWTSDEKSHWHAAICGHDEVSEKAEHVWDKGEVTKPPKENEAGSVTYSCSICGATKTENISTSYYEQFFEVDNAGCLRVIDRDSCPSSLVIPEYVKRRRVETIAGVAFSGWTDLREISFLGTKSQWENVSKGVNWTSGVNTQVIHCSDGDVDI